MRGDADKVKAIEIGYKAIGDIQPTRIVANAQAGAAIGKQGQTFCRCTSRPGSSRKNKRWLTNVNRNTSKKLMNEGLPRAPAAARAVPQLITLKKQSGICGE